jgi:hypothetical protein
MNQVISPTFQPLIQAMTIINAAIQHEIESATDEEAQLQLAQFKFEINQLFDRKRREARA